ncbi:MAG: PP2C family serine/threonine-protein phosphatase [Anaerolineales bacterium]
MKKIFRGLRSKKKKKTTKRANAPTVPLSDAQVWDTLPESGRAAKFTHLISGSALHPGQRRENNEDAVLCLNAAVGSGVESPAFGIYVIADGMGGHRNGEVASETAVRALGSYLIGKLYKPLFGPDPQPTQESLQEIMEAAVQEAHRAVKKEAPGGGCTLTAALVLGNQMVIAHLGDSRAYAIYRDGRMEALTTDHSLVKRLQEMGQLTEEEAAIHPQKSVLYRALGQGEKAPADIFTGSLPNPGFLLICSDGLWGVVAEDDIQRIVSSTASPFLACQHLVEAANAAGGPDNISVVLVRAVS